MQRTYNLSDKQRIDINKTGDIVQVTHYFYADEETVQNKKDYEMCEIFMKHTFDVFRKIVQINH